MNASAISHMSRMSADEFLVWTPDDELRWQLVDGEPVSMTPANRTHGAIQMELGGLIRSHLRSQGTSCSVVGEPGVVPRARSGFNVRIPDLAVTCSPYGIEEATLSDPVLIVEIVSPSNETQTRSNVWAYTTIPSVREILLIHTSRVAAEMLRRLPDGTWPESPMMLSNYDTLALDSIGLALPLADAYATTRLAR